MKKKQTETKSAVERHRPTVDDLPLIDMGLPNPDNDEFDSIILWEQTPYGMRASPMGL